MLFSSARNLFGQYFMKNIQVIDGAENCTFDFFEVSDDLFLLLFPEDGQNVEFIEDAIARLGEQKISEIMRPVWQRRVKRKDIQGIHGTLFYGLLERKQCFPDKDELD